MGNLTIITTLSVLLPVLFALVASTLSGILAQDHLAEWQNEMIACSVVVIAAIASTYISGLLTGDLSIIVGTVDGVSVMLISSTMKPLQRWTHFLQANMFVVKDGHLALFGQDEENMPTMPLPEAVNRSPQTIVLPEIPKTTLPPSTVDEKK